LQFRSGVGAVGSKSSQAKASLSTRDGACFSRRRLLQQNRHIPEVPAPLVYVGYRSKTGRHLLAMSSSQFDPNRA
jgi:hypothetical protein